MYGSAGVGRGSGMLEKERFGGLGEEKEGEEYQLLRRMLVCVKVKKKAQTS